MQELLQQSLSSDGTLKGAMVWMFAQESYPDYDGYTVYGSGAPDAAAAGESAQPVVKDVQSVQVLRQMCRTIAAVAPS